MNFHELKDLVTIYESHDDNFDWDKANITLWDPFQQKQYDLIFTGSSKAEAPGVINFNITEHAISEEGKERIDLLNHMLMLYKYQSILNKEIEELNNKIKELNK